MFWQAKCWKTTRCPRRKRRHTRAPITTRARATDPQLLKHKYPRFPPSLHSLYPISRWCILCIFVIFYRIIIFLQVSVRFCFSSSFFIIIIVKGQAAVVLPLTLQVTWDSLAVDDKNRDDLFLRGGECVRACSVSTVFTLFVCGAVLVPWEH